MRKVFDPRCRPATRYAGEAVADVSSWPKTPSLEHRAGAGCLRVVTQGFTACPVKRTEGVRRKDPAGSPSMRRTETQGVHKVGVSAGRGFRAHQCRPKYWVCPGREELLARARGNLQKGHYSYPALRSVPRPMPMSCRYDSALTSPRAVAPAVDGTGPWRT